MNAAQKIMLEHYAGGEFSHIATLSTADAANEVHYCGDGLLRFLFAEMSDTEDCDSVEEAHRRVSAALRDLTIVLNALSPET